MYELKKIGKVFTSKFVGTGPSSYKKRIYRAAISQRLRNTDLNCPCLYNQVSTNAREYVLRFLRRSHPDKNVFRQLGKHLTAMVLVKTGRLRTVRRPTNEDAITAAAQR